MKNTKKNIKKITPIEIESKLSRQKNYFSMIFFFLLDIIRELLALLFQNFIAFVLFWKRENEMQTDQSLFTNYLHINKRQINDNTVHYFERTLCTEAYSLIRSGQIVGCQVFRVLQLQELFPKDNGDVQLYQSDRSNQLNQTKLTKFESLTKFCGQDK